jgi:tRNA A37 N6-isopentenylltransferase MiaA
VSATFDITNVEQVNWTDAVQEMDWRPGEHVTLIGPTGAGKTELTVELARERHWEVFLSTKRVDSTQQRLRGLGFRTITSPAELNPEVDHRFTIKPPWPRNATAKQVRDAHARIFREALNRAFYQTGMDRHCR